MQLLRQNNAALYQITAYTASSITVNDQTHKQSILIMPQHFAPWHVNNVQDFSQNDLLQLLELKPELILIGSGSQWQLPNREVLELAAKHKIGLETMDTPAACRTYTVLTTEGRNVLAAVVLDV